MTERELFSAIMHYQPFARMPAYHWVGWPELNREWAAKGVPENRQAQFFGADPLPYDVWFTNSLFPSFTEEVIEETNEYRVARNHEGVVQKYWRNASCIPQFLEHTLKDRASWEEHFKPRLQPDPARLTQKHWNVVEKLRGRTHSADVRCGSMIGKLRDWMGVEGLAYVAADDPELLGEMIETVSTLSASLVEPVVAQMDPKPECGWFWEDICCKSGPLVSPRVFEKYCVPAYRRITDMLRSYGVDIVVVDCDGVIDALVPGWMEAGVNTMFPIEIGVWEADPMAFRRKYGTDLRIIGGIDKKVLYHGPEAIDAEIQRRVPLMKEGGYIPLPDHLIPPGVTIENYQYYINAVKALKFP
jgi:hypothetical protein